MSYPKPTNASNVDYPTAVGAAIDALNRRLKGNLLDNGAFQVWQRGTSIAASGSGGVFTADRWAFWRGAFATGATVSRQAGGNAQYCARVQRDNANASTQPLVFGQSIESVNSIPCRSRNMALAFRARMGEGFSSASQQLVATLYTGTGTDQSIVNGLTGQTAIASLTATLTTSWQDFTLPIGAPGASISQLAAYFTFVPVGSASPSDYFEIEEAQLVVGDYAGNFPYRTYGDELANCLRFCEVVDTLTATVGLAAVLIASNVARVGVPFKAIKRATPTATSVPASVNVNYAGGNIVASSLSSNFCGPWGGAVDFTVAGTPFTLGQAASVGITGSGLMFSADI